MAFQREKLSVRIFESIFPLIYGVCFYSWIVISERILRNLKCPGYVPYLFFLPVVAMELWAIYYFLPQEKARKVKGGLRAFVTGTGYLISHLLLQYLFFFLWVICPLNPMPGNAWMSTNSPYILPSLWLCSWARPFNSLIILALAGILYYFFWVKRRAGRIFFGVAFLVIFFLMSYLLFYFDVIGGQSKEEVIKQPGVSIILPYGDFQCGEHYPARFLSPFRFPRCLQADWEKGRLYLSFGAVYPHPLPCPHLIACDLDGKNLQTLSLAGKHVKPWQKTYREFQIEPRSKDFYISSWGLCYKIYRIDRLSLSVLEEIPFDYLKKELKEYNLYDIVSDSKNNRLFFITGQPPAIIKMNLIEKTAKVLNLTEMGITEFGSLIHMMRYDRKLNRIYMIATTGDKGGLLIEVDPENMLPTRILCMPGIIPLSLELDSENNEILMGTAINKGIFVIERKTWEIEPLIPTPFPTIRRFDIDNENGLLYVVDYLRGHLYVIKRDSGKTVKAYKVGNKPIGMVRNGSTVYVASVLGIIKIDASDLLPLKSVKQVPRTD